MFVYLLSLGLFAAGQVGPPAGAGRSGSISTVAGSGAFVTGDHGWSLRAGLDRPGDVPVDGTGKLYIGDLGNNRVRRVDLASTITTVAGTGSNGFSGDGRQAADGRFERPAGVAMDDAGNPYIADPNNNRVRGVTFLGGVAPAIPMSDDHADDQ